MLIAISQRQDKNKYGAYIDYLENSYINYFEKLGATLLLIPNSIKKTEDYFKNLPIQGVILSGGNNLGEAVQRDETERKLIQLSIKKNIPVLGICRGLQFINEFCKGKLIKIENHADVIHKIKTEDKKEIEVNSFHNFGVTYENLGNNLKSFAESSEGIIEGLYHKNLPIAAIQWHPERSSPNEEFNNNLIRAFLNQELFWRL